MDGISSNYKILIYLISCALNKKTPDKSIFKTIDLDALKKQSSFHSVSALAAKALSPYFNNREFFNADEAAKWGKTLNNSIRRNLIINTERNTVCDIFEENGIWHIPLKGSIIQNYYPYFGIREMNDVDILVDGSRTEELRDIMVSRGYRVKKFGTSHHDVYQKEPVHEFELHTELFAKKYPKLHEYYSNVKERLIKKEGRNFEYAFTPDDFYIYITAHACKHLNAAGIGLKPLADIYVYRKSVGLDYNYIEAELYKMELRENEKILRGLSEKLFSNCRVLCEEMLTEEEAKTLSYMIASGSDGTVFNRVKNNIYSHNGQDNEGSKSKKLKYICKRLFLKPDEYEKSYPFFYKHKWARPFLPLVRLGKSATVKRKDVMRELDYIKKS